MTRSFACLFLALACLVLLALSGCGMPIGGPRFWWDDQKRQRMPDGYDLPPLPAADAEEPEEKPDEPPEAKPKADTKKESTAGAVPKGLQ